MKSTLMIKDLALDKQLDRKSMSAVRGGNNSANVNVGGLFQETGGGVANTSVAINAPTVAVTQVDLSSLSRIPHYYF